MIVDDPLSIEFTILGTFGSPLIIYQISAVNLVASNGDPLVNPKSAQFNGLPAVVAKADLLRPLVDVRNPQDQSQQINGGLIVNTAGDYQLEGGTDLLKKLILRRVLTAANEFLHLSNADYGMGIQPELFLTDADLVGLKAAVDRQVLREPEVEAVKSQIVLDIDNTLTISLAAKVRKTNQQITLSVPVRNGQTNLVL